MPGKMPGSPSNPADEAERPQVARVVATWRSLIAALVPVIGERGVGALLERSIQRAAREHEWLRSAAGSGAIADLERAFAARSAAEMHAAHADLLVAFVELLEHLVGRELAQRLLEPNLRERRADDDEFA